jgi:hypothetical protein
MLMQKQSWEENIPANEVSGMADAGLVFVLLMRASDCMVITWAACMIRRINA